MKPIACQIAILMGLLCSSCASLLNSPSTRFTLITKEPVRVIIHSDTTAVAATCNKLSALRSKKNLTISIFNDSLKKTVSIKPINSLAYLLNIGFMEGLGLIAERNEPKRFTYPKTLFIDLFSPDSSYLPYNALDRHCSLLKTTPLKLIGFMNPSFEISYEQKINSWFTSQFTASYLFPSSVWVTMRENKEPHRGFGLSAEQKLYFKKSAPHGTYCGLEVAYRQDRFNTVETYWHKGFSDSTYMSHSYDDAIRVYKQTTCFNIKIGYQQIIKRFVVDCYAGIGLKYRSVRELDRINPNDQTDWKNEGLSVEEIAYTPGKLWTISIPLNIRVGWTF